MCIAAGSESDDMDLEYSDVHSIKFEPKLAFDRLCFSYFQGHCPPGQSALLQPVHTKKKNWRSSFAPSSRGEEVSQSCGPPRHNHDQDRDHCAEIKEELLRLLPWMLKYNPHLADTTLAHLMTAPHKGRHSSANYSGLFDARPAHTTQRSARGKPFGSPPFICNFRFPHADLQYKVTFKTLMSEPLKNSLLSSVSRLSAATTRSVSALCLIKGLSSPTSFLGEIDSRR